MRTLALLIPLLTLPLGVVACGAESADNAEADDNAVTEFGTGPKLKYDEYSILFTNPLCKKYAYGADQKVVSQSGKAIANRPENVFCTQADSAVSAERDSSPQHKLLSWINDPATKEIFFTYLSFSNSVVNDAMCKAVTDRGVKITFVLDNTSDTSSADKLTACKAPDGSSPRFEKRGHVGGIGFAHNKVFAINPKGDHPKFVFSSGNLSSGVVLHHENWHFIQVPKETHFAQAHLCLIQGELDHATSKKDYRDFIKTCRAAIKSPEESDMRTFFVPGDGTRASTYLIDGIAKAAKVDLAAHRFSYTKLKTALDTRLLKAPAGSTRFVADDDMYWSGQGTEDVGDNDKFEWYGVKHLQNNGMSVKWMETNDGMHLLHHNKYAVLTMPTGSADPSAVFGGAGNLTGTAFDENLENFYYITIPEVVTAFQKQYEHVWNDLASKEADMPTVHVLPPNSQ